MIIRIFASSVPTKPLNDAQMRGAFLYIYVHSQNTLMERLPHFTKHYMTEADLVALLESRGLVDFRKDGRANLYGHNGCKCKWGMCFLEKTEIVVQLYIGSIVVRLSLCFAVLYF